MVGWVLFVSLSTDSREVLPNGGRDRSRLEGHGGKFQEVFPGGGQGGLGVAFGVVCFVVYICSTSVFLGCARLGCISCTVCLAV